MSTEEVRSEILEYHLHKFTHPKKSHQTNRYDGAVDYPVPINRNMTKDRLLVRHLSTVLLSQKTEMIEIQSAINHREKKIYIASNKYPTYLKQFLPFSLKLCDLFIPSRYKSKREKRHAYKLRTEIKSEPYKDYQLHQIKIPNSSGQHAEAKIISVIGLDFDYIGGTRRPCVACYFYMQIKLVPIEKYNQHNGAFWDSSGALFSLCEHTHSINKTKLDNKFYFNEGLAKKDRYSYDTDSDDD